MDHNFNIQAPEVRKNLRLNYLSPIHFSAKNVSSQINQDKDLLHGMSKNFSAHGLQIISSSYLNKGDVVQIFIPIAPYGIIPVEATVQWTSIEDKNPKSPHWLKSGLKINHTHNKIKRTFLSYLKEQFKKEKLRLN